MTPPVTPPVSPPGAGPVDGRRAELLDLAAVLASSGRVHRQGGRTHRSDVDEGPLVAVLEEAYPLGRWRSWQPTELGASNTSWFVETDAGSVVLRRSHQLKTVPGARFEAALLDLLGRHGLPAPGVERTREGDVLVQVDGALHMVMRRLPGERYDPGVPAHLAAAAGGLGRYHGIVRQIPVPPAEERSFALARLGPAGRELLRATVERVAPALEPEARRAALDAARSLTGAMERLTDELGAVRDDLTTGIVHGSYGPTALLLTGDRLTGVLDFDRAAPDLLALDVAYAIDAFCRPGPVRRTGLGIDPVLARRFLDRYREEADLTDADLWGLPRLLRAQRLGKVLNKCDNLSPASTGAAPQQSRAARFARTLERERSRVEWLEDNLTTLTEEQ